MLARALVALCCLPPLAGCVDWGAFERAPRLDATTALDASPPDIAPVDSPAGPDAPSCFVPTVADYCLALQALPTAPVIDGVPDCGLTLQDVPTSTWPAGLPMPAGVRASFAAAWRPDGLYVIVRVTTPSPSGAPASEPAWCADAVMAFVDADGTYAMPPDYDATGTRQLIVAAPTMDHAAQRGEILREGMLVAPWSGGGRFGAFPTTDGYVVEMFVTGDDLGLMGWTLEAGGHVGLDVSVNVALHTTPDVGPCSTTLGQFSLRLAASGCHEPYCNVTAFCTPTLRTGL